MLFMSSVIYVIFKIHWIQQIQAIIGDNNKPIIVVGTHADKLAKQDPNDVMQEVYNIVYVDFFELFRFDFLI